MLDLNLHMLLHCRLTVRIQDALLAPREQNVVDELTSSSFIHVLKVRVALSAELLRMILRDDISSIKTIGSGVGNE